MNTTRRSNPQRMGSSLVRPCRRLAQALAALICVHAHAADAGTAKGASDGVVEAMLIAIIAVPAVLMAIRWLLLWRLRQLMGKASDAGAAATAGARAVWSGKKEVASARPLAIREHAPGDLPAHAASVRESWVARALAGFRRLALIDAAVAGGYLLLPLLLGWLGQSDPIHLWSGWGYALFALLLAALRYGGYRNQFRADGPQREGLLGGLAHGVRHGTLRASADTGQQRAWWLRLLRGVTWPVRFIVRQILARYALLAHELYQVLSPRLRLFVSGLLIVWVLHDGLSIMDSSGIHKAVGAGFVVAALLHAATLLATWLHTRSSRGARLLVLRVFDIDENANFTFGGVLAFWKHFGNYFTVVDRSVWRHELRLMSRPGFMLFVALVIGVAMAHLALSDLFGLDAKTGQPVVVFGVIIVGAVLGALGALRWLGKNCIRSREHLLQGLQRLERQPRGIDLSYKPMRVSCYDNTWRVVVDEFAQRADAVLMDLRGLSASNQGCADEVDFLFDHVPLHKIVFIADAGTDQALVRRLLQERWQMLAVGSPNLPERAPTVCLYVAHVQDPLDVQCILDLLMLAADAGAPEAAGSGERPPVRAAAAAA